ncbi:MAG: DNA polymerase III subunit beta [Actinomycetota bacterium]
MKSEVLRDDFQKALQTVQHSVSPRSVMPILSGVSLEALDGKVKLFTTDLESSTTTCCGANVEEKGVCVVNHRLLLDLFRDSDDERLVLETAGNELEIRGEKNVFRIFTLPVDDFPGQPVVDIPVVERLDPATFTRAVQAVSRAASKDEKRPTLTGVYMEISEKEISLVSTDSYRLAVKKISDGFMVKEERDFIIPASALLNFSRLVSGEDPVNVYRDENAGQLRFDNGKVSFTVRLIDGKFPRYEQFIPESTGISVEIGKEELLSAIKRTSLVNTTIKIQLEPEKLTLNSESRDVGEAKEKLEVNYHGDPFTIAFNGKFLEEGIISADGDTVVLGLNEPLKPGVIKEKEREDYIYVIMPIRI